MSDRGGRKAEGDKRIELAEQMLDEYRRVEADMSSPAVLASPEKMRALGRRYAELGRVARVYGAFLAARADLDEAREIVGLGGEDAELFRPEIPGLEEAFAQAESALKDALIPRDPDDARDAIVEVKAGAGGEESALFAGDLLRMYQRYAEAKGWSTQILGSMPSELGGYKDVQMAVRLRHAPEDPADGVWAHLKYEAGVHRVQRIPVTESQGRIHTSAAGVLVFAEVDDPGEVEIADADIRVDVFRSSGPGGQSVNTTDSAVRITHIPTGLVVSCQDEKSQIKNRESAMRVLRARLRQIQLERHAEENAAMRRSQVRTVDRSERIRTYNFPENRVSDHRTGYKAHNLDQVLAGDLEPLIDSARRMDEAERIAAAEG